MPLGPFELDKEYALQLLAAIKGARPLPLPPGGAWRRLDLLSVAGACLFGAWSHGPVLQQPDLNSEQQETAGELAIQHTAKAADFLSRVFSHLEDGHWEYGDTLSGVVNDKKVTIRDT